MSEERLERIEKKLDALTGGVDGLTTRVDGLTTRVDGLTTRVDGLTTRVDGLTGRVDALLDGQTRLRKDVADTDRRLMRVEVGQEEMRDQIQQIAEGYAALPKLWKKDIAELRTHIDQRLDPIEVAVRTHFGT